MPPTNDIIYFAETNFRNERKKFGVKRRDRSRHMYVIGKTGMGKTTLLENMAVQDIVGGEGLGIVDPHGEFAEKMLRFVPKNRIKDVVYFAPHDVDYPIAFNIMEDVEPTKRHLVSTGLLGVFKKIWPDVWSARMEYILNNAILALLEYPHSTLLGINRMLSDKDYRSEIIAHITDPSVRSFWVDEFSRYTDRFMTEAGAAIQNKVGQFTSNPLIRNIIGQPKSTIDMRDIMDNHKILILNLSKGRIGEENSRLIGAMLITKIYLAAMSRVDVPEEKRSDFYLYVDEFQNFATESFKDILAEARKYRLNLILAHQYIAQMEEPVRDAVIGNVGTMMSFRVGAFDAELLEKEFAPDFTAQDMVNLGFAQIYLRLMIDGVASRPFSATTLPPMRTGEGSYITEIVESSRAQYALPRAAVEAAVAKWYEPLRKESAPGFSHGGGGAPRSFGPGGFSQRPPGPTAPNSPRPEQITPPRPVAPRPPAPTSFRPVRPRTASPPPPPNPRIATDSNQSDSSYRPSTPTRTISLKDLKAKERSQTGNLQDLRAALKSIVEEKKAEEGETPTAPKPRVNFREMTEEKKRAGTLRPGDKIQL